MDYYVINRDGNQVGPYTLDQFLALCSTGHFPPETLFWTEGLTGWQPMGKFATITPDMLPSPSPLPSLLTTQEQTQNVDVEPIQIAPSKSPDLALQSDAVGAAVGLAHHSVFSRSPVSSTLWGMMAASCFYQSGGDASGAIGRFVLAWVQAAILVIGLIVVVPAAILAGFWFALFLARVTLH